MRQLLMLTATLILLICSSVAGQNDSIIVVTNLTDQLYLLTTDQGSYTTNSMAFVGDDGVLLVDTQSEAEVDAFKKVIDGFGKGAPKYIISTHRHVEHIGGNHLWGAGPVIIAHHLMPEKLQQGGYIFDEFPPEAYPEILVYDSLILKFNGETIRMVDIGGCHDDNEIMVHFVNQKVAHLSSIVNGFNFPSIDSDGDALRFAELAARAMALLPDDVTIVSGHNAPGTYAELQPYHDMMVATTAAVKAGIDAGKDLATLKEEKILAEYDSYAGSYVSTDEWIGSLYERITEGIDHPPQPHPILYHEWKANGAESAVALYFRMKEDKPDDYYYHEFVTMSIGGKLLSKDSLEAATLFLEASLEEYPDAEYAWYTSYLLAQTFQKLEEIDTAIGHCEKALEGNPEFGGAKALLEELKQ